MNDLKICRICLRTQAKMYKYDRYQLKYYYEEVMALKMDDCDGLPRYYCYECATTLHKIHKFKEKCYIGQSTLKQLLWKGPITYESVHEIDRSSINLTSPLSIMMATDLVKKYIVHESTNIPMEEQSTELNDQNTNLMTEKPFSFDKMTMNKVDDIVFRTLHLPSQNQYDASVIDNNGKLSRNNIDISKNDESINEKMILHNGNICNEEIQNNIPMSPQSVFINGDQEIIKLKPNCIQNKKRKVETGTYYKSFLNTRHWKVVTLTEDEALQEFRGRAQHEQYTNATFKCQDCFRGFSKEDMLRRHLLLRHTESEDTVECHFCHVRFRYKSFLSKHLCQHYVRYVCLRCDRVCPFETSAIMHEEYHSGVTTKCRHCDKEFRHRSTYYSHVRSLRGAWACARCGAAFASERGLRHHRRLKHARLHVDAFTDYPDDDEDDDEVNTYCVKCKMMFETRRAYEEHLFQSTLHSNGTEFDTNPEKSVSKKILGKKEKKKLTEKLKNSKEDEFPLIPLKTKRKTKVKRQRRKPTTCHQMTPINKRLFKYLQEPLVLCVQIKNRNVFRPFCDVVAAVLHLNIKK